MTVQPPTEKSNRLTLAILMLWVLATCAYLAYERWSLKYGVRQFEVTRSFVQSRSLILAPLDGACCAAVALCIWRRFRGAAQFPTAPGHWLLVLRGGEVILRALNDIAAWYLGGPEFQIFGESYRIAQYVLLFGVLSAAAIVAAVNSREMLWRTTFAMIAVAKLFLAMNLVLNRFWYAYRDFPHELAMFLFPRILLSLPVLFAILGSISDLRQKTPRDFLHWAGVSITVLLLIAEWPLWIYWRNLIR